ncbi:MAG: sigma-70 family RNA polymerase sigma factor [Gemmataceae bacterium]
METASETDEALAGQIAARDSTPSSATAARDACRVLYDRHARKLLAFLAGRVKPGAVEDIAQDVWHKVWQSLPTAFHGGNFRAWLYTIARNNVTDHLRRKKAEALPEEGALADHRLGAAHEELAEAELRDALARCLQKLEKLDSQLADLVRSRVSGESYDDFCARTGLPADKAYRAFHHAKAQLQACVDKKVNQ